VKKSILNIGLARKGQAELNSLFVWELLIQTLPAGVFNYKTLRSQTEPTLVAEVATDDIPDTFLEGLAVVLGQDCLACLDDGKTGRLVGPRAADWGTFSGSQFYLLNGNTLE